MNAIEQLDHLIADAVDASDELLGFVRENEDQQWRLLCADDAWIDVGVLDNGLLAISTEIGSLPHLLGSSSLNELMLTYAGFSPDTSFSMSDDGTRRIQQVLPADALRHDGFKEALTGFATKAQAWRELLQSPGHDTNAPRAAHTPEQRMVVRG